MKNPSLTRLILRILVLPAGSILIPLRVPVIAEDHPPKAGEISPAKSIFLRHCAKCHGADAEGRGKKPSLRSSRVQSATDGEIFWLLRNGNLGKGMPTWSKLPEETRWQVIAYVKSLGKSGLFSYAGKPATGEGR